MTNEELMHYGVLGMKWGVRRSSSSSGGSKAGVKKGKTVVDAIRERKAKKLQKEEAAKAEQRRKDIESGKIKSKDMTDDELKNRKARLQLEKDYNDLISQTRPISRGKKFVEKFKDSLTEKMADNVAADLVSQSTKVLGETAINAAFKHAGASKGIWQDKQVFTNNKKKS